MIISKKIKNTKLIINIVVLILIYFFSFHIFPKLSFYNKLEYKGIRANELFLNVQSLTNSNNLYYGLPNELDLDNQKNIFLNQYFYYLINNNNLISDAPCPKELMVNKLRNIQIFYEDKNDFLGKNLKFNVRFSFYKFFWSPEKLDINKCFDYIFKENLNKYFLLHRERLVKKIEDKIKFINFQNNINNQQLENSKVINDLLFSTFLGEVEKGNILSVDIMGNSIEGTFTNGTKFRTYSPYYPNLVEKLSSKGVSFSLRSTRKTLAVTDSEIVNKLENFIILIRSLNYFVDPNVSYTFSQQKDKSSTRILTFIISLLLVVFINIVFLKFNKKQISKFFNKFMNS
jgi:hypothetical protein